ncbi:MAG: GNAT family N-acetyltransferase [Bacteroidota bacterium]
MPALSEHITLRPENESDADFLESLYAMSRDHDMKKVTWSQEQKTAFLKQQFSLQTAYYRNNYNQSRFLIIELDKSPAGRYYVEEREEELQFVDIIVHQQYRNKGLATFLINQLKQEAVNKQKPIRLYVDCDSWVKDYYLNTGFKEISTNNVHVHMEWIPENTSSR